MKYIYFLLILFFGLAGYSQTSYVREWGTMNNTLALGSNNAAAVNPINGNIYFASFDKIYEYTSANSQKKTVYTFPPSPGGTIIENIKFDSKGNIIFSGRTLGNAPVTPGTYSQTPFHCGHTGATFIAKININGNVIWCTYFHCLSQNTTHLAVDQSDNIYFLNKRDKNTVLNQNVFQATGDHTSIINLQDVISKLNSNGQHLWSTFYTKDQSLIRSIVASDDGLYVYGDHMASTSTSNYFGTKGSYQEYATGVFTGGGGNEKNVFLSKFSPTGNRMWSTYFAVDRSMVPHSEVLKYFGALEVIGNEAYILTKHEIRPIMVNNPTTAGAFLRNQVSMSQYDITASKFSNTGARVWTTFLYGGETIYKMSDTNELFITATIFNNNTYKNNLITNNGYQTNFGGGFSDNYFYTLSNDGKKMNYGSFYGFSGSDYGVNLPTHNGFYSLGYSMLNPFINSPFASNGEILNQFTKDRYSNNYQGSYSAYFKIKSLGIDEHSYLQTQFKVYPNPTTEILNIESNEILPNTDIFTIYDITGREVINQPANASTLNTINVSKLNSGVYVLKVQIGQFTESIKFIKK